VGATGGAAGGGGGGGREHGSRQRSRVAQGCGCASVVTARRHHASDQFLVFISLRSQSISDVVSIPRRPRGL
jgi:hypothetical protein